MENVESKSKSWPNFLIPFFAFLITVGILPEQTLDPINPVKSWLLGILVLLCSFQLLRLKSNLTTQTNGIAQALISLLIFLMCTSLLFNHYSFSERMFGVFGRNTGFLTYTSIAIVCLATISLGYKIKIENFLFALMLSSIIVMVYFIIQLTGNDPFKYSQIYSAPSSTLGNPNFVSGFIGFSACVFLYPIFQIESRVFKYIYSGVALSAICLSIIIIAKSESIQGFFALALSLLTPLSLFMLHKLKNSKWSNYRRFFIFTAIFVLSFISSFTLGFLVRLDLGQSIMVRFDYWRAGILMILDKPLLGTGFDAFGDFYRQYRSSEAFYRFDNGFQVADSAHNFLIDFAATGGTPLTVIYIAIQAFAIIKLMRYLKMSEKNDSLLYLSVGAWSGFHIQSLVTVTQISNTLWGWILTAIIIARTGQISGKVANELFDTVVKNFNRQTRFVSLITSLTIGLSSPFMQSYSLYQDVRYYRAARVADGLTLKQISLSWPHSTQIIALTAKGFENAGYQQLALEIADFGVRNNPRSYLLWRMIFENPSSPSSLKDEARSWLGIIEPRIPWN